MNKKIFSYMFLLAAILAAGGYLYWYNFLRYDPTAEAAKQYQEMERRYIEAMTADTYGGKTPQETLDMFVDALRKDDIELASKYFMLDENLSREKWITFLVDLKRRGYVEKFSADIKTKARASDIISKDESGYVLYNKDGTVGLQIDMRLNKYSQVWKIERL